MRPWSSRLSSLDEMFYILIGALALLLGVGAVYLNWQKAVQAQIRAGVDPAVAPGLSAEISKARSYWGLRCNIAR